MQWNQEKPKRRALCKFFALLLAAIMLTSPILTAPAHASPVRSGTATVRSATITSTNRSTYLTFDTSSRVQFLFRTDRDEITLAISGARSFPSTVSMAANPIFTSGRWVGNTLHLTLTTRDGIIGYYAFYDSNDNLVIRFRNPPATLSATRVVIDPGHGGEDRGAEGFRRDLPEAVINQQISQFLAEELRDMGVTVLVLDTADGMELRERIRQAERFDADFFISIHNNAARNANTRGTEVWFFTAFSNVMAATTSRNVSRNLGTLDRGTRRGNFTILRNPSFISVMVEAGFMTNREEYEKLITPSYQQEIARGIADAVASVVAHSYPGTGRLNP